MSHPWDSKTYVSVSAAASPLFEDVPPNRLLQNLMDAILNDGNIASHLLYNSLTNYQAQIKKYYNFAKNNHVSGLPYSSLTNSLYKVDAVKGVLNTIHSPETVLIAISELGVPTLYNWARYYLQENEGANYDYMADTLVVTGKTWNITSVAPSGTTSFVVNLTDPLDANNKSVYGPIASLPVNSIYYSVEYELASAPGLRKIWLYQADLGTYPTLTEAEILDTTGVFPIVAIRYNDVNVMDNPALKELYDDNKRMLKLLRINYDDLSRDLTSTADAKGNRTPVQDLHLISDIFFMHGINVYGESQQEKKALFVFFDQQHTQARFPKSTFDSYIAQGTVQVPQNRFYVRQGNFQFELEFNYIQKLTVAGVVSEIGEYTSDVIVEQDTVFVHTEISSEIGSIEQEQIIFRNVLRLRKQINATEYIELRVDGLTFEHRINSILGAIRYKRGIEAHTPGAPMTEDKRMCIIPFNASFFETLSTQEGDSYIPITAHVLFYASDSIRVSGWDRFLSFIAPIIQIIAIVIFIFSLGQATSVSQALWVIAKYYLAKLAFEYILRELLIAFDGNRGAQIAVILAASYYAYQSGGAQGLSTAQQLMLAVNALASSLQLAVALKMEGIEKELADLESGINSFEEELKKANEFLEVRSKLDIYSLQKAYEKRNGYEKPEDFFARTLNTAPGQMVFDQLHGYVDNNLNLKYI